MCFAPQRRALTFSTSQLPKVVRNPGVFNSLTSKCASRHNGVHLLFRHLNFQKWSETLVFLAFSLTNVLRATTACISTSKSGLRMVCFAHFDFEMCFAPQRHALFRHLNCQKWSGAEVFCAFWLRNVLRATTACNFSSLIWPDGSAPAALASLLFDPPEPQIIKKHSVSRLSYLYAHLYLLASDSFSSLIFSLLLLLLFSSLWLFPTQLFICPYCRKFDF